MKQHHQEKKRQIPVSGVKALTEDPTSVKNTNNKGIL